MNLAADLGLIPNSVGDQELDLQEVPIMESFGPEFLLSTADLIRQHVVQSDAYRGSAQVADNVNAHLRFLEEHFGQTLANKSRPPLGPDMIFLHVHLSSSAASLPSSSASLASVYCSSSPACYSK